MTCKSATVVYLFISLIFTKNSTCPALVDWLINFTTILLVTFTALISNGGSRFESWKWK